MLRLAIVEEEGIAKDIIFELQKNMQDEFSFVYFEKISQLIKSPSLMKYDVIILNEAYNNVRVSEALNHQKTNVLLIYCSEEEGREFASSMGRIFRIYKGRYKQEIARISHALNDHLVRYKEYLFSYNGIKIRLQYKDIMYIEKEEKNLVYHTKKGLFYERCSIVEKTREMEEFGIIRIHNGILVNYEYIFQISHDEVELIDHTTLPISRARKNYIKEYLRSKAGV